MLYLYYVNREKVIEYDKLLFLCFVDLKQAFDHIRLEDVKEILKENRIDDRIIQVIQQINEANSIHIRTVNKFSKRIPISIRIRERDSMSPT